MKLAKLSPSLSLSLSRYSLQKLYFSDTQLSKMAYSNFFRIVLKSNLRDKMLMIPKEFAENYGRFLSSPVRLKLPDSMEWKVGLTIVNGMFWLEKGWHQFAEYYSLVFGSLLLFRYDGNSNFRTMIFDVTGLEIEYSRCDNNDGYETSADEDKEDKDSAEIHGGFRRPQKKRKKASLPCHQPCKKMRNEHSFEPKVEPQAVRRPEDGVARRRPEKAEAVQSFGVSKSENLGFVMVMRQTNVEGRFNMVLPRKFARKYLNKKGEAITIQIPDGRTWSLIYKWTQGDDVYAYISSGWKHFAIDNSLKEGDIAVFQMIKKDKFLFSIKENYTNAQAKLNQYEDKRKRASSSRDLDASQATIKYTPSNPFFEVVMSYKGHRVPVVSIPASFSREHLSPKNKTVKLQIRNSEWEVKLKKYNGWFRFSAGWSAFYRANSLESGNKFVFEMVNEEDYAFKVTIF